MKTKEGVASSPQGARQGPNGALAFGTWRILVFCQGRGRGMVCTEVVDEECGRGEAGLEGKYCVPKR